MGGGGRGKGAGRERKGKGKGGGGWVKRGRIVEGDGEVRGRGGMIASCYYPFVVCQTVASTWRLFSLHPHTHPFLPSECATHPNPNMIFLRPK